MRHVCHLNWARIMSNALWNVAGEFVVLSSVYQSSVIFLPPFVARRKVFASNISPCSHQQYAVDLSSSSFPFVSPSSLHLQLEFSIFFYWDSQRGKILYGICTEIIRTYSETPEGYPYFMRRYFIYVSAACHDEILYAVDIW